MVTQKFDKEQNILFVDNTGRLEFEAMRTYFSSLKDYSDLGNYLFVLEDARKVNVKFSSEHLDRLSKVLSKVAKEYEEVYHAVLLNERKNVAYATMINEGISEPNYFLRVFSSYQIASDWVKNKPE